MRAVSMLAHTLGMRVTAEGVEQAEQLTQLKALGCELGQGHYFAPPMLAKAIDVLFVTAPYSNRSASRPPGRSRHRTRTPSSAAPNPSSNNYVQQDDMC